MVCLLVLASCQKPEDLAPGKDISYTQADFVDTEAIGVGSEKAGDRRSDLKVVIRKVNNAENTYRLVLKVDSVALNSVVPGENPIFQPVLGSLDNILAGLTIPDPTNPDLDQAIFTKEQLVFRKTNENGYFVFVSDPFVTKVNFDYELVGIEYAIELKHNGLPVVISDKADFFILPGGKSVEQAPDVAKVKAFGRVGAGENALFESLRVTTFDDPIGEVKQVVFKGSVIGLNNNKKEEAVPLASVLESVEVSGKIGVSNWTNATCINFYDEASKTWRCADEIASAYTNLRDIKGTVYLLNGAGREVRAKVLIEVTPVVR